MVDAEKIEKEGVKLLEEFEEKLKDIDEGTQTHYVVDLKNVWRADEPPIPCIGFWDKIKINAPKVEEGYIVAEKDKT
jgi:predicted Asp-tRNA(Asn)/Glu-tRNA(Gln) amidotransferase subunit C